VICGSSLLNGPSKAPARAVVVHAGDDSRTAIAANYRLRAHTTYWFAPGTHTLGSSAYSQIEPANGDTFIGAPGAVISGQGLNDFAFVGGAGGVTVEHLTIEDFVSPDSQGVVNHDSGANWTISYDTVKANTGAGVMLGSNDVLSYNCLLDNGQYGFSAYSANGVSNVVVDHNEVAGNDTEGTAQHNPGCGCFGGAKFWDTDGASVTDNYIYDNNGPGLWADTNNVGFNFSGNYIANNWGEGVIYEISYNAQIVDNTFFENALGEGPTNPGFPTGAIYISESGSDSRVASDYSTAFDITGNVFVDNWAGVVLWENADRFCGSPDNSSSGYCTLVDQTAVNLNSCDQADLQGTSAGNLYYADCRWHTQNVQVSGNLFNFSPADIDSVTGSSNCTAANSCGLQGVFSNYGSAPSWSPYLSAVVEDGISNCVKTFAGCVSQDNRWSANTYQGPWEFMVRNQGTVVRFRTWQKTWGQDTGSTITGSCSGPTWSVGGTGEGAHKPFALPPCRLVYLPHLT
jgi:hypothetical protein